MLDEAPSKLLLETVADRGERSDELPEHDTDSTQYPEVTSFDSSLVDS